MKRLLASAAGLIGVALLLVGCGGTPQQTREASVPPEDGGERVEQVDAQTWYQENCPAQVGTYSKSGDTLWLVQAAVKFNPEHIRKYQPRIWRYDPVSMRGEPIDFATEQTVFCYRNDAESVKYKYQNNYFTFRAITAPEMPQGYYIGNPDFSTIDEASRNVSSGRVLISDYTPIADEVLANPLTIEGYAPGDGPG